MREQRITKRTNMLKHAMIVAKASAAPIDCMVYDLTDSGAGLRISPDEAVPDRFELFFGSLLSSRHCQVQWRNNERMGIAFDRIESAVRAA